MQIIWILNGCGLEDKGITGGPVRFHEISRRWINSDVTQHLETTSGGAGMLRGMGCSLPYTLARASFFLKHEPNRAFRLWSYIVTSLTCGNVLKQLPRADAVFTVSDYFCDIIPALRLKRRDGAKWIAWIHHRETHPSKRPGNRFINTLTYKMQEWSFRRIAQHADQAWIYDTDAGDLVKARLRDFGMPENRIRIMRCGINVADITAAAEPQTKSVDAVMVGLRPNKGLFDIIPIWERVLAKRPKTTLCLMGGMSGETGVIDEIKRRGYDNLIEVFKPEKGFLPAAEYYSKIKQARVMFAPSHEEGWGIAVCEGMAAGLPVACYALPVYGRIYGDALMQVECFNFDMFADAIVKMLDSTDVFADYRARGIECAANFDWDALAESDLQATHKLLND